MKTIKIRQSGDPLTIAHIRGMLRELWNDTALCDYAAILAGIYLREWNGVDPEMYPNGNGRMRTDGEVIEINPETCVQFSDAELLFILCHEAQHCLANHSGRFAAVHRRVFGKTDRNDRDVKLSHTAFNIAADYTINADLCRIAGYTPKIKAPKETLRCPAKYAGQSTEAIYRDLIKDAEVTEVAVNGSGDGSGIQLPGWGEVKPNASLDEGTGKQAELLQRAITVSKSMGKDTGNLESLLHGVLNSPEDWRAVLREYLTRKGGAPTWRRCHRRNDMLPTTAPSVLRCLIGIDTSGSMSQPELTGIIGDCVHLTSDMRIDCMILQCDTDIKDRREYAAGEVVPWDLPIRGGGGTSFRPVLREARDGDYDVLLYFTDLGGDYDESDDPGIPVVWIVTAEWGLNQGMLFGELVSRPHEVKHAG